MPESNDSPGRGAARLLTTNIKVRKLSLHISNSEHFLQSLSLNRSLDITTVLNEKRNHSESQF